MTQTKVQQNKAMCSCITASEQGTKKTLVCPLSQQNTIHSCRRDIWVKISKTFLYSCQLLKKQQNFILFFFSIAEKCADTIEAPPLTTGSYPSLWVTRNLYLCSAAGFHEIMPAIEPLIENKINESQTAIQHNSVMQFDIEKKKKHSTIQHNSMMQFDIEKKSIACKKKRACNAETD